MIKVEVQDQAVLAMLGRLQQSVGNMQPAMAEIGDTLANNIGFGFVESRDPWGSVWKRLSKVTAARRKQGNGGQPLMDTGNLRSSITFRATSNSVEVGTNIKYARTHQFGAKQGAFGRTRRGAPIPWGNIPARPFMPIRNNRADLPPAWRDETVGILQRRLMAAAQ